MWQDVNFKVIAEYFLRPLIIISVSNVNYFYTVKTTKISHKEQEVSRPAGRICCVAVCYILSFSNTTNFCFQQHKKSTVAKSRLFHGNIILWACGWLGIRAHLNSTSSSQGVPCWTPVPFVDCQIQKLLIPPPTCCFRSLNVGPQLHLPGTDDMRQQRDSDCQNSLTSRLCICASNVQLVHHDL